MRELFDLARLPKPLRRYLPSFRYVLDDLHDEPPARLRQRALSVFGLCTLSALQYLPAAARDPHAFDAWLAAWHDVQAQAARLEQKGDGRDLFDVLVDYVFATSGLPAPEVQRLLTRRFPDPTMKSKFVSTAQQLRNEGKVTTLLRRLARRTVRRLTKRRDDRRPARGQRRSTTSTSASAAGTACTGMPRARARPTSSIAARPAEPAPTL